MYMLAMANGYQYLFNFWNKNNNLDDIVPNRPLKIAKNGGKIGNCYKRNRMYFQIGYDKLNQCFYRFFEKNAIISKISTKNGFPDMQKNAENGKQLKRTNKHISR